jgi:light-regulated signal transduction histidine kinase (bacteriophytochrome)
MCFEINLFLYKNLPTVTGDPVRIGQVFTKFNKQCSKIYGRRNGNCFCCYQEPGFKNITIDFEITHIGIGIANDKYDAIFESSTQANSDTKFGGTGLELTITKRIPEMHGSKIQLKSAGGKGSTFYFSLTFPVGKADCPRLSFKTNPSYIKSHPG